MALMAKRGRMLWILPLHFVIPHFCRETRKKQQTKQIGWKNRMDAE